MQSFVQFLLVPDFADVDRIAQDVVEGPAREGRTTTDPTKPIGSLFADDAQRIKPCAQLACLSPLELCQYILAKGVRKRGSKAIF